MGTVAKKAYFRRSMTMLAAYLAIFGGTFRYVTHAHSAGTEMYAFCGAAALAKVTYRIANPMAAEEER